MLFGQSGEHFFFDSEYIETLISHAGLRGETKMRSQKSIKMFSDYPDVVSVKQMCSMLGGIGKKTAYDLLQSGEIKHVKIGKSFKIPKVCIIEYLIGGE